MSSVFQNFFDAIPPSLPAEVTEVLASGAAVRIERIISQGHSSPADFWYDQAEAEWVMLLQGAATLHYETGDRRQTLSPGDFVLIPPHCRHRVEWTQPDMPTLWLAIFFMPSDAKATASHQ